MILQFEWWIDYIIIRGPIVFVIYLLWSVCNSIIIIKQLQCDETFLL